MNWKAPNKDIAVIKVDIPYNMNPANLFVKLAKKAGYNVVIDETAQLGVTDWSPVIRKIERKKPAYIVFFNLMSSDAARFQKAFYERFARRGLESLLVYQYTPSLHEFQKLAGEEAVEGVIYMGASIRMGNPRVIEYTKRWREKYKETPTGAYAWLVRDAFEIWVQAVKRAGCVECYDKVSQKIREAPYSGGLWANTYVFHPEKQEALVGEYLADYDWLQIRNGKHLGVHPDRVKDTEYQKQPWMKK